jgi:hypothetical protein
MKQKQDWEKRKTDCKIKYRDLMGIWNPWSITMLIDGIRLHFLGRSKSRHCCIANMNSKLLDAP